MKKDKKITGYFDNVARNYYHKNIKVDDDFFKFIANKLNSSEIYCKSEYRKAQVKLYNRISYFRKNKNIISLSESTGVSMDDLLKLAISDDLKLTKTGIELFKHIYNLSVSAYKSLKKKSNESPAPESKKDKAPLIVLAVF